MEDDAPQVSGSLIPHCAEGDGLCVVRQFETEVIIVPVLLLAASFLVGGCILWMVCRPKGREETNPPSGPSEAGPHAPRAGGEDISLDEAPATWTDPTLGQWEIARERLRGGLSMIGLGTYGPIYRSRLAMGEEGKERPVVIKQLHDSADGGQAREFLARVRFQALLGPHGHLVEMLGCCTGGRPLCLVMEDMRRNDLLTFLWTCRKDILRMEDAPYDLTERQVYDVALQVASGLGFLHRKGLIHGDVAARNVLLQEDMTAKLGGLRIPFDIQRSGVLKPHTSVPVKWQSPERIVRKPLTPKTDIWSFGVLLFEMVTLGSPPYPNLSPSGVLQYLQRGHRMAQPATCRAPLYGLMKQCWQWRESSRPPIVELKKRLEIDRRASSDSVVLRVPDHIEPEAYAIVAGTYEANGLQDYTIL